MGPCIVIQTGMMTLIVYDILTAHRIENSNIGLQHPLCNHEINGLNLRAIVLHVQREVQTLHIL